MSFSFSVMGTRDEVLAQIPMCNTYGNQAGEDVKELLTKAFTAEEPPSATSGYEYRWAVNASGHSGSGSPLSLNLTVTPAWVPVPPPAEAAQE